jgi:hypothetical protein
MALFLSFMNDLPATTAAALRHKVKKHKTRDTGVRLIISNPKIKRQDVSIHN